MTKRNTVLFMVSASLVILVVGHVGVAKGNQQEVDWRLLKR